MANHSTHQQGAIFAGLIGAVTAFYLGMTSGSQALIVFAAGYTGGMAPDLDHDQGKSLRTTFRLVSLILPLVILWRHPEWRSDLEIGLLTFIGIAVTIYVPIQFLFKKLTVHRGIFHSVPAVIIYGQLFFLLVNEKSDTLSFQKACGIVASLGYITHLLLDEYSSLNFNGQRFKVKRSLGTAIDFIKPNRLVTGAAYMLVLILSILIYGSL